VTLGVREDDVVDQFSQSIVPRIVEYEHMPAKTAGQAIGRLDDKIQRALGVLRNARLISSQEALFLLSHIRLG